MLALIQLYLASLGRERQFPPGQTGKEFQIGAEKIPNGSLVSAPGKLPVEEVEVEIGNVLNEG